MKVFAIFVAILACVTAQAISGTLGVASSVTANTQATITYPGGLQLIITVDQNSQVTLSSYVNIAASLPQGFQTLSFGANVGFTLDVTPSNAVVVSAVLTTPSLTVAAAALIAGTVDAGCLQFDANAQAYSQVAIDSYNAINQRITITLPGRGTYVFVAVQQDVSIPTFYNQARAIVAGVRASLSYVGGFVLNVTADASTTVTVTYTEANPEDSEPENYVSMDAYYEITLGSSAQIEATLIQTFEQAELDAKATSAANLEWAFFDEASGEWNFEGESVVDANARTVTKTTNHFSSWGVYASSSSFLVPSALFVLLLALFNL